jgi:hypothetical protein
MKSLTSIAAASILLTLCMSAALAPVVLAEGDAHVGSWQLNLAKSTFNPGPPPKRQTLWYKSEAGQLTALLQGLDAEGRPISPDVGNLVIYFDGKDHPTARPGYDSSAWTRISARKYVVHRKKNGKTVLTSTNIVSDDGRTMTITTTGTDENGRPVNNVRVYDRQ